jgi:hypothetical protein
VAIAENENLQNAPRDQNGTVLDPVMRIQELSKADELRAQTTQYMCDHIGDFSAFEAGINSDMPANGPRFSSICDRIAAMASPTTPIGELEINAASEVLKKPIHIVDSRNGHVLKYNADKFRVPPIKLRYSAHGDNCGHYECLVPHFIPIQQLSPLNVSVAASTAKRNQRKTMSEVLRSTPYKKKLMESTKKAQPKSSKTKVDTKIKTKKRPPLPTLTEEWYCFLCEDYVQEDMIQCVKCTLWAHEDCAGTRGQKGFTCELCKNS